MPKCYGQKPNTEKMRLAYYLLGEARSYLEEDASRYRRPIVTHVYRDAIELYDRHLYEKGGLHLPYDAGGFWAMSCGKMPSKPLSRIMPTKP